VRGKDHRPPYPPGRPQMCDRNDLLMLGELLEQHLLAIGGPRSATSSRPTRFAAPRSITPTGSKA
jgi:hypothetical protein